MMITVIVAVKLITDCSRSARRCTNSLNGQLTESEVVLLMNRVTYLLSYLVATTVLTAHV